MDDLNFNYLCDLVKTLSGNVIEPSKKYLAEVRLNALAKREKLASPAALIHHIKGLPHSVLHYEVVEALLNHETLFYRDPRSYELLQKVVFPSFLQTLQERRELCLWSAACSTGQEPYSIAILIRKYFPQFLQWNFHFVASDLCKNILERSQKGIYSQLEVHRGLTPEDLATFFSPLEQSWRIREEVQKMIHFQQINLVKEWPPLPPMDLIFMRNVLIYFDTETKQRILKKLHQALKPQGCLFFGGAETSVEFQTFFKRIQVHQVCYYQKIEPL
jgi:chemotaxis protein methyltransferase CheR